MAERTTKDRLADWTRPWILAAILGTAIVVLLLSGGPGGFVATMDEAPRLFTDFTYHYLPMARAMPEAQRPVSGYFYPPFLALALMPLADLGPSLALWAWTAFQLATLALFVAVSARLCGFHSTRQRAILTVAILGSVPVLHSLAWGQVSVLVTALLFLAMTARPAISGTALGIATALKLYPLLFAPLLLWRRRPAWRAGAFLLTALSLLLVLPLVAMGWAHLNQFHEALDLARERTEPILVRNPKSLFSPHVVARWTALATAVPAGWILASRLCGGALILLGCLAARRFRATPAIALGIAMPATAFLVPTSWPHYFVYLPPLLCWLALAAPGEHKALSLTRKSLAWAALIVTLLPFQQLVGGWPPYHRFGWLALANLACLLAAGVAAFEGQGDEQPEPDAPC